MNQPLGGRHFISPLLRHLFFYRPVETSEEATSELDNDHEGDTRSGESSFHCPFGGDRGGLWVGGVSPNIPQRAVTEMINKQPTGAQVIECKTDET